MSVERTGALRLTLVDRFFAVRIVAGLFLGALYLAYAIHLEPLPRTLVAAGAVAWTLGTAIGIALRRLRPRDACIDVLWSLAVLDSVALGLLTASLGAIEDPFFAWYIAEAVVFSMLLSKRSAWVFAGLFSASYLLGHASGTHTVLAPLTYGLLASKAVLMLVTAALVGSAMERHVEREAMLEEHGEDAEQLNARLERSLAVLRAVSEISELIHSTLDTETVGPTVLDILQRAVGIPAACVFVVDKRSQQTVFTANRGLTDGDMYPLVDLAVGEDDPERIAHDHFACIELVDQDELKVVFCADSSYLQEIDDDDRAVLLAVASELAVAVDHSRLYKLTKRLAVTDDLTDLYNYRYLQQRLDDEIGRVRRYDKRLSFLMIDIDNFKRVNDTWGHPIGDVVLAEIGRIMKSCVREVDVVARYGGEEFSVILPETDASGAFIAAEKIREAIEAHRFADEDGERSIRVTLSIGLANYPLHAYDKESLLKAADDAVYQAKAAGRNRVRAPLIKLRRLEAIDDAEEGS